LWFVDNAEEAARFYASIFPGSRVDRVTPIPADTPSGPAGSVPVVEFTLFGQTFMAISAGSLDPFNHAISFMVNCADQTEINRYWDALLDGGTPEQCGWLKDRYGISWQIVPTVLGEMITDPDRTKAKRVAKGAPNDGEARHRGPQEGLRILTARRFERSRARVPTIRIHGKERTRDKAGKYVDGFVVPMPKKNIDAYRQFSDRAGRVWKEHGALEYIECIGDDVKPGKVTSFPQAVKLEEDEIVVFSWMSTSRANSATASWPPS
jgi:predicted 3-demethylubiquinone-9 3-methyltransferase (glyoxalase superfamily)/uncharacterized protein YbaA (DUF1428 family)